MRGDEAIFLLTTEEEELVAGSCVFSFSAG
jgi:hypothetical protein